MISHIFDFVAPVSRAFDCSVSQDCPQRRERECHGVVVGFIEVLENVSMPFGA